MADFIPDLIDIGVDALNPVQVSAEGMAPGGGFVFCLVHNVQPDVPPENIEAMYEALEE